MLLKERSLLRSSGICFIFSLGFSWVALGKSLNRIVKTGSIHWKSLHFRYYDKYFTYVTPLSFSNNLVRQGLPLTPFYSFRSWGLQKLSSLSNVTKLSFQTLYTWPWCCSLSSLCDLFWPQFLLEKNVNNTCVSLPHWCLRGLNEITSGKLLQKQLKPGITAERTRFGVRT